MDTEHRHGSRVLVIGLDGGTFSVLRPLIAAGTLPNLGRIMQEGAWRVLRSTVPPHSAPAWSSFATGANPGRHGVYHFRPIDRRFYEGDFSRVVNARSIALPTIWARASQAGKRVGVVNVPLTYPPEPVNGFMITGMLTPPSAEIFTYPPELSASLRDYVVDIDAGADIDVLEQRNLQTPEGMRWLARTLEHQLAVRTRTAARLFAEYQPDLAVVVLTETDRLHHFFWPCLDEQQDPPPRLRPYCSWAREFYARLDEAVGRISAAMGEDKRVRVVMSDHGFGPYPTRQFYANAWLRDLGFLKMRATSVRAVPSRWLSRLGLSQAALHRTLSRLLPRHQVRRLRIAWGQWMHQPIDWERSQACFMPLFDCVGGIIINLPADSRAYWDIQATLASGLRNLVDPDTGSRIVAEVYQRDEIYQGVFVSRAPDLIFMLDPSYVGERSLLSRSHFGTMAAASRQWTGTHRFEGILLMDGPPICPGEKAAPASVQDIAPTILHLLGLPIPDVMDGRVLGEMFQSEFLDGHPVLRSKGGDSGIAHGEEEAWGSDDEEEQIAQRLRALGYLE